MIQMLQLGCSRAKGVYTRWVEAQTFPVRVEKIDWLPRQLVRSQLQRSYYLCMCLIRLCCLRLHRKLFDRSSKDKQGPGKNIFLCLLMMIICQAANRREVQVFFLDCFLWILIHVRKRNIRGSHKTIHLQMDVGGVRTFVCETKYVHACGNYASESSLSLPSVLVLRVCMGTIYCVFVCNHMLSGPISSHSPLMFTWSSAAVKSKGRNGELCAHLSQRLQMEGGSFYSSHPLMRSQQSACVQCMCTSVCVCVLPHLGPPALPDLSDSDILFAAYCEPSISSSRTAVKRKDFNIFLLFFESFVLFSLLIYGGNWGRGWLIYT